MQKGIDIEIARELKIIKDRILDSKKSLNDYTNMRDDENESNNTDSQIATCELSEELDERITDVEIAICELSEILEGGE